MIPAIRASTSSSMMMLSAATMVRPATWPSRNIFATSTVGATSAATPSRASRPRLVSAGGTSEGRVSSAIEGISAARPAAV